MSTLRFGQHLIKASAVILQTELSFALVNRKPVVPGRIFLLLRGEKWARKHIFCKVKHDAGSHVKAERTSELSLVLVSITLV